MTSPEYISISEHKTINNKLKTRNKKEIRIMTKAIQDLNKTIKKLQGQENFLNDLLDNREIKIRELEQQLKNWKFKVGNNRKLN